MQHILFALLPQSQEYFQDQQNHLYHFVLMSLPEPTPAILGKYQATIAHFEVISMRLKVMFQIYKDMLMMHELTLSVKSEI